MAVPASPLILAATTCAELLAGNMIKEAASRTLNLAVDIIHWPAIDKGGSSETVSEIRKKVQFVINEIQKAQAICQELEAQQMKNEKKSLYFVNWAVTRLHDSILNVSRQFQIIEEKIIYYNLCWFKKWRKGLLNVSDEFSTIDQNMQIIKGTLEAVRFFPFLCFPNRN